MLTRVEGLLETVSAGRATVRMGPVAVEVMVPAADEGRLHVRTGKSITFHTLMYLEGSAQGANMTPRLVGFTSPDDRAFFELFTTVKGVGAKKALRALALPFADIAGAIANRDYDVLKSLPEIGKRTAETIVAELGGKVDRFVEAKPASGASADAGDLSDGAGEAAPAAAASREAIQILVQLGEAPLEARRLVGRVNTVDPDLVDPGEIVAAVYRLREVKA